MLQGPVARGVANMAKKRGTRTVQKTAVAPKVQPVKEAKSSRVQAVEAIERLKKSAA